MYEHASAAYARPPATSVLRRIEGEVACFTTISCWESRAEIQAYAGEDIARPHHLPKDPEYLLELPDRVRHHDVLMHE